MNGLRLVSRTWHLRICAPALALLVVAVHVATRGVWTTSDYLQENVSNTVHSALGESNSNSQYAVCTLQLERLRHAEAEAAQALKFATMWRDGLSRTVHSAEKGSGIARKCKRKEDHTKRESSGGNGIGPDGSKVAGWKQTANLFAAFSREIEHWLNQTRTKKPSLRACNSATKRYSVIFDAGSTGSRVHVYRFGLTATRQGTAALNQSQGNSLLSNLRIEDELFLENHQPLSSFEDLTEAAASLKPLLEAARQRVPAELHACAGIELKATAGLRRVGSERAEKILAAVRREFQLHPFWLRSELDAVRILEGREEGPLAWLTVNFLLGSLGADGKTATILDLGGGSTQIVMHPANKDVLNGHDEFSHAFNINGRSIVVYQHSYEGYGLNAAREQLLAAVSSSLHSSTGDTVTSSMLKVEFPCFPIGYSHKESGVSNGLLSQGVVPSLQACIDLFRRYVVRADDPCSSSSCSFNGVFQPDVTTSVSGPVYAFSFYYDLLRPHVPGGTDVVRLQDVIDIADHVCRVAEFEAGAKRSDNLNASSPSLKPEWECLHHSYIVALLRYGFRFSPQQELHIAKKIAGFETSWSLGASIASLEQMG
ncbi:putative GDA1 CD39 (nucleoside phosphatase) family [Trypanosoma vivax]|nr:putative GDA1 CD39 (nucleoside phosphatase) family [Trypanosoma vivax]